MNNSIQQTQIHPVNRDSHLSTEVLITCFRIQGTFSSILSTILNSLPWPLTLGTHKINVGSNPLQLLECIYKVPFLLVSFLAFATFCKILCYLKIEALNDGGACKRSAFTPLFASFATSLYRGPLSFQAMIGVFVFLNHLFAGVFKFIHVMVLDCNLFYCFIKIFFNFVGLPFYERGALMFFCFKIFFLKKNVSGSICICLLSGTFLKSWSKFLARYFHPTTINSKQRNCVHNLILLGTDKNGNLCLNLDN